VDGVRPGGRFDASVWLLHAMYETADLPAGITHDDVDRIERAAAVSELETVASHGVTIAP
jgi:hypothetical protein